MRGGKIDKIIKDCDLITSKEFHDGVEFLIRPIAELSRAGSQETRELKLKNLAIEMKRPILEINQVGSIDCWSYSGQSLACDENGEIFSRAFDFEEQLLIVNPFRKMGKKYSPEPQKAPNEFTLDYNWEVLKTFKNV